MLDLLLVLNYVLNFFNYSSKSKCSEFTSNVLILLFLLSLYLVDLVRELLEVNNLCTLRVKSVECLLC